MNTSVSIGKVPPNAILAAVWKDVWGIIERFGEVWLQENELDEEELFRQLLTGQYDLWLAMDGEVLEGVIITQLFAGDCYILWAGGMYMEKYLLEGLSLFERYAVHNGTKEVKVPGRPGWKRLLEKVGYKPDAEGVLSKNLHTSYGN